MEKSLKVAKKMISFPFPKNFYSDLVDKLSATNLLLFNDIGGKVIHPVKARFQADSLIVRQIFNGESTLCLANDTDYGFMGGSKVLQVSSFKLQGMTQESKSIININIITPDTTTFKALSDAYNTTEKITTAKAKFPIFDSIHENHHYICALCAVTLGNDTNPGGINGIGPIKLSKMIESVYGKRKNLPVDERQVDV